MAQLPLTSPQPWGPDSQWQGRETSQQRCGEPRLRVVLQACAESVFALGAPGLPSVGMEAMLERGGGVVGKDAGATSALQVIKPLWGSE